MSSPMVHASTALVCAVALGVVTFAVRGETASEPAAAADRVAAPAPAKFFSALGSGATSTSRDQAIGRALVDADFSDQRSAMAPDPRTTHVAYDDGGYVVRILAGEETYCFTGAGGGSAPSSTCGAIVPTAPQGKSPALVSGAVFDASTGPGRFVGMIGDGARDIQLRLEDKAVVPLQATNNVVTTRIDSPATSLSWTNPDGSAGQVTFDRE